MSDKKCPLMKRKKVINGAMEDIFLPCIKNDCMAWDEQDNICSMFSSKRVFSVEAKVDTRYSL